MIKKMLIGTILAACMAGAGVPMAMAQTVSGCTLNDGFAALDVVIPETIGSCISAPYSPAPGVVYQPTSGGMLSWTSASNTPRFTDSFATWSLLPGGLQVAPPDPSIPMSGTSTVAGVTIGSGITGNTTCVPTPVKPGFAGAITLTYSLSSSHCYAISY